MRFGTQERRHLLPRTQEAENDTERCTGNDGGCCSRSNCIKCFKACLLFPLYITGIVVVIAITPIFIMGVILFHSLFFTSLLVCLECETARLEELSKGVNKTFSWYRHCLYKCFNCEEEDDDVDCCSVLCDIIACLVSFVVCIISIIVTLWFFFFLFIVHCVACVCDIEL